MNPRIKWTFKDFKRVLVDVGFRDICMFKEGVIVAVK